MPLSSLSIKARNLGIRAAILTASYILAAVKKTSGICLNRRALIITDIKDSAEDSAKDSAKDSAFVYNP